jgi:hypothetical protein
MFVANGTKGRGKWTVFCMLRILTLAGLATMPICSVAANAEVLTDTSSSWTAEASWTNCPTIVSFDGQLCNYTAIFAARGSRFQPFVIIQMENLAMFKNGTVQIASAAA